MSKRWDVGVNERIEKDAVRLRPTGDRKIRMVIETSSDLAATELTLDEWYEFVGMGNELAGEIRSNWDRLGGDDE